MELDGKAEWTEASDLVEVHRRDAASGDWQRVKVPAATVLGGGALLDAGGLIAADLLPSAIGESFIVVDTTSSPIQNGLNLIAAVGRAGAMTPNGSALTTGNPVLVIVFPAVYDLNGASLTLPVGVMLHGVAEDPDHCRIRSAVQPDPNGIISTFVVSVPAYGIISNISIYNVGVGITAITAINQVSAYSLHLGGGSGAMVVNCVIGGVNALLKPSTVSNVHFYRCYFTSLRYVALYGSVLDDCRSMFYRVNDGSPITGNFLQVIGCTLGSGDGLFRNCRLKVELSSLNGRMERCLVNYVATTGDTTIKTRHYYCDVLFAPTVGFSFLVGAAHFHYCIIAGLASLKVGQLVANWKTEFHNSHITQNSSDTYAPLVFDTTPVGVLIHNCKIIKSGTVDYLLAPSNAGTMDICHSRIFNGYTLSPRITLATGTLAAGFNVIEASGW